MLLQDLETYLDGEGPFTDSPYTYELYIGDLPNNDKEAIALLEAPGKEALRTMGASLSAPVRERPVLLVYVRGPQKDYVSARTIAETVHQKLDGLFATLNGRQYHVMALYPPARDRQDRNGRWIFITHYLVEKEQG